MPFITFTTTKTLTLNQEKALKESAGQLISILPHKKEFAEKLLKEVERITKIPVEQQYLSIEEFENWGKNGEYL